MVPQVQVPATEAIAPIVPPNPMETEAATEATIETFADPAPNPETDEVFYPDCDGQPLANNTEQFEIIMNIKGNLDLLFAQDPNVLVAGDLFWYPIEGNPTIKYAPDILVALGRPKARRYSYKQWTENNQPPQVVFEILSPGNSRKEMDRKLLFYDRYGVEEYYIYNPANHKLSVWLRGDYGLDLVSFPGEWVSPRLGIRFDMAQPELAIFHPDGQPFLSFMELCHQTDEIQKQLEEEQHRAELAQQQLEEERHRAELVQQRAERLAEQLRSLGLDPDAL
ncbi:MAG: Uma2 family endonuclease [Synechococcales bacterium]|nr:Uma2 family endonuclease [Synechococcales bacterium]